MYYGSKISHSESDSYTGALYCTDCLSSRMKAHLPNRQYVSAVQLLLRITRSGKLSTRREVLEKEVSVCLDVKESVP